MSWLFLLAATAGLATLQGEPGAATPEAAAASFVEAFNRADPARFNPAWADDATLFWPGGGRNDGRRIEGKPAILAAFHAMFDSLKARRPGSLYLDISPQDLKVQDLGETAILSFHLGARGGVSRRTLVMRRDAQGWRIVHLHGSFAPAEPPAEGAR